MDDDRPGDGPGPEDPRELLARLRAETPRVWVAPDPGWLSEFLWTTSRCVAGFGVDDEVTTALATAARQTDDPAALFDAGWHLIEIGLGELAVAPLARSLQWLPDNGTVLEELAVALDDAGRPDEGVRLFRENWWCIEAASSARALYSKLTARSGDLRATEEMIPYLDHDGPLAPLREWAVARVARARALGGLTPLDGADVRGWDAVLHGMLLLERSPFGDDDMHGRYAAVWDNDERFPRILHSLRELLARVGRLPARVVAWPDRDSQVLGWALASVFGTPSPGSPDEAGSGPRDGLTLAAAYTWSSANEAPHDPARWGPEVVLFAYSFNWPSSWGVAPDVSGISAQMCIPAWGASLRMIDADGDQDQRVERIPADDRDPREIGVELAARPVDLAITDDLAEATRLADALHAAHAPLGVLGGPRMPYQPGGPVSSQMFP